MLHSLVVELNSNRLSDGDQLNVNGNNWNDNNHGYAFEMALASKILIIKVDTKFFIADNEQVLFMISKDNMPNEEIAVWLNTPFFATTLGYMFDSAVRE